MRLKLSWVLILIALSVALSAANAQVNENQLQNPTPGPGNSSKPPQEQSATSAQQSDTNQRQPNPSPIIVNVLPPQKTQDESDREVKAQHDKASSDWWQTIFNGLLVVFTAILALIGAWQGHQNRKSAGAARDAADVALATANSLTAAERAYVFVNVKPEPQGFSDAIPPRIIANCCNHGKTPARIGSLHCRPEIVAAIPVVLPPTLEEELPEGLVIASGGIYGAFMQWGEPIPDNVIGQIKRGERFIVCYGFIRYYDIFDGEWETGFCWQYDDGIRRFRISNSPLNYCRKADLHNN